MFLEYLGSSLVLKAKLSPVLILTVFCAWSVGQVKSKHKGNYNNSNTTRICIKKKDPFIMSNHFYYDYPFIMSNLTEREYSFIMGSLLLCVTSFIMGPP